MTGESARSPAGLACRARLGPAMSWLSSFEGRGFVYSVAGAVSGCGCPFDDGTQAGVGGVSVPPGDAAADHAVLFAVGGVIGAVEGELAQRGELAFEAVHPREVPGPKRRQLRHYLGGSLGAAASF